MDKSFLLLVLGILIARPCHAQVGQFAYAVAPIDIESDEHAVISPYKQRVLEKILHRLVEAKGNFQKEIPTVHLSGSRNKPAWIDLNSAEVFVEEKTYDLCTAMGADSLNALAAILAHELIHYYEDHDWHDHILRYYGEQQAKVMDPDIRSRHLELEFRADQQGGFLAEMAGFQTLGILPALLTQIYDAYGLSQDKTSLYPSLEERKQIAAKSEEVLNELTQLFYTARYFTGIGNYQKAADYLDHILTRGKFGSREIFNNLASLYILSALQYFSPTELPFALPIEFDFSTRLARRSNMSLHSKLLQKANHNLEAARRLDKQYVPAVINMAIVQILLENHDEAKNLIDEAQKLLNDKKNTRLEAHLLTLSGIIAQREGDTPTSKKFMSEAHNRYPSTLTSFNLNRATERKNTTEKASVTNEVCQMGEYPLKQLYSKLMREEERASMQIDLGENHCFYQVDKEDYMINIDFVFSLPEQYTFFAVSTSFDMGGSKIQAPIERKDLDRLLGTPETCLQGDVELCTYWHHKLMVEYSGCKALRFVTFYTPSK